MGTDKNKPKDFDAGFVIAQVKNKDRRNSLSPVATSVSPPEQKSESTDPAEKEGNKETAVNEEPKRKKGKLPDYATYFLRDTNISSRNGKLVSIRNKHHDKIANIVHLIAKNEVSIFSYIDNVLSLHFEHYQDEIKELFDKNYQDIINQ